MRHGLVVAADELQQPADEAAPGGVVDGHHRPELRPVDLAGVIVAADFVDLIAREGQVAPAAFLMGDEVGKITGVVACAPRQQGEVAVRFVW